jgi:PAS domain S-box-containing protein
MKQNSTCEELEKRVQELEKELHDARFLTEKIMTYMTEGLVLTDTQGTVTFINQRLLEMLGYLPGQIIGKSWLEMVPPGQLTIARAAEARRAQGKTDRYEIVLRRKSGLEFPVMIGAGPRFDKHSGEFIGTMGVVTDITKRRQAEAERESAWDQYQSLVNNIPGVVYRCRLDKDWTMLFMSDAIDTLSGYPASDFIGNAVRTFESIIHPDDTDSVAQSVHSAFAEGRPWNIEYRICHKDGDIRWVQEKGREIPSAEGSVASLDGFILDITERIRAEGEQEKLQNQLLQARKMESVGRLAGGVAHDFNNMLGVILGQVEFALEKIGENHDLSAGLKEIQTAARRSADLTRQLLTFARKQIISPRPLNLNDTVESMLNMLRRLIGEDIDLVWKPAAHPWTVEMDPSQIDQILANLCINARDAIAGVGRLTIETGKKTFDEQYCRENAGFIPGDYALLSVSDNGCGMDKETLKNLFEPFFTTKEMGKGTGLGLATIYGIVKQNSGFINVYSEPGQGSTFNIYLPRFAAEVREPGDVAREKAASGGMETILVVEDEPAILRMTRMMLEQKGYAVLSAAAPAEAIKQAQARSSAIDLLLSDVVLPEMSGRDLAGQIMGLCPGIRVLFMSGYTADVIAHQGVLDDGVAFIQKPFSMNDLAEKVRGVLDMAPE